MNRMCKFRAEIIAFMTVNSKLPKPKRNIKISDACRVYAKTSNITRGATKILSYLTYELKFKKKWSIEMRKFNS